MNYRHLYHAGNFADVFKHLILISLLQSLQQKPKAFCYLDTHAGTGYYDTWSNDAQKTQEFMNGVSQLATGASTESPYAGWPPLLRDYWRLVTDFNRDLGATKLRYYPGSPCLARRLLRTQDRMVLAELHPSDAQTLKQNFYRDASVATHHLDGYHALKAFLPPMEQRGLVLLDPPFEQPNEHRELVLALTAAYAHWRNGMYAIWHPIKEARLTQGFYRRLIASPLRDIVSCELTVPVGSVGLQACGMIIVNPPWRWSPMIAANLAALCRVLAPAGGATYRVQQLVAE